MPVFCHIVTFINLFASIAYMAYALCTLPKKVAGIVVPENKVGMEAEKYRLDKFSWEMAKVLIASFVSALIGAIACLADGITNESYMHIPALIIGFGGLIFMHIMDFYYSAMARKNKIIVGFNIHGEPRYHGIFFNKGVTEFSMLAGFLYATTLGVSVYTFILMFV